MNSWIDHIDRIIAVIAVIVVVVPYIKKVKKHFKETRYIKGILCSKGENTLITVCGLERNKASTGELACAELIIEHCRKANIKAKLSLEGKHSHSNVDAIHVGGPNRNLDTNSLIHVHFRDRFTLWMKQESARIIEEMSDKFSTEFIKIIGKDDGFPFSLENRDFRGEDKRYVYTCGKNENERKSFEFSKINAKYGDYAIVIRIVDKLAKKTQHILFGGDFMGTRAATEFFTQVNYSKTVVNKRLRKIEEKKQKEKYKMITWILCYKWKCRNKWKNRNYFYIIPVTANGVLSANNIEDLTNIMFDY